MKLKLNEFEMTGHFLGQHKKITLLEADAELVSEKIKVTVSGTVK